MTIGKQFQINKPGVYLDLTSEAYLADPCPEPSLTQSIAKVLIEHSELHARAEHPRFATSADDEAEKYVKAKAIGNAVHAILIGRGKTIAEGAFDNWMSKDSKAFRDDAESHGRMPILSKHLEVAQKMADSARRQIAEVAAVENEPALLQAFNEGQGEVCIVSEEDGLWRRSLVDWMASTTLLFDYKSTGMSVAPHSVPNLMADAGWPIQAAMQDRILDAIDPGGAGRRRFFFIAHEQFEPFALTVHELPRSTMTLGHKMLDKAEVMWRRAMATGQWPSYAPRIHRPEYPGWKESQWLDREISDAAQERVPAREPMLTSIAGG